MACHETLNTEGWKIWESRRTADILSHDHRAGWLGVNPDVLDDKAELPNDENKSDAICLLETDGALALPRLSLAGSEAT